MEVYEIYDLEDKVIVELNFFSVTQNHEAV